MSVKPVEVETCTDPIYTKLFENSDFSLTKEQIEKIAETLSVSICADTSTNATLDLLSAAHDAGITADQFVNAICKSLPWREARAKRHKFFATNTCELSEDNSTAAYYFFEMTGSAAPCRLNKRGEMFAAFDLSQCRAQLLNAMREHCVTHNKEVLQFVDNREILKAFCYTGYSMAQFKSIVNLPCE